MLGWLKRKSGEHQLRNARYGLAKLIAAANALDAAWTSKRDPTPQELAAFNKAKSDFCLDTVGPIPLEEIRRDVIDPALADPAVSDSARTAVTHAYEYMLKQSS